ncbi:unnamed protein product, partial [marine sediment metagenome]
VINIADATNLERSLNLTLQLIKRKVPLIVALNFWDETKHTGGTLVLSRFCNVSLECYLCSQAQYHRIAGCFAAAQIGNVLDAWA